MVNKKKTILQSLSSKEGWSVYGKRCRKKKSCKRKKKISRAKKVQSVQEGRIPCIARVREYCHKKRCQSNYRSALQRQLQKQHQTILQHFQQNIFWVEVFTRLNDHSHAVHERDTVYVGMDGRKRKYKQKRYLLWKLLFWVWPNVQLSQNA